MTEEALQRMTTALAAMEVRLTALEHSAIPPADLPPLPSGTWWALDELATRTGPAFDRDDVAGSVMYAGRVRTPGTGDLHWQMERPTPDLLDRDWSGAATVLSALGHPVRLAIVQHLLRGARTLQDLLQIDGLGTTGQLQHHLRELRTAGLVEQPRRNDYAVPARHVVPCLVIIAAASDVEPR